MAVWPRQRPVSSAAKEFLKLVSASGKKLKMSGTDLNFTLGFGGAWAIRSVLWRVNRHNVLSTVRAHDRPAG